MEEVREGTLTDVPEIAEVQTATWKESYRGIVPQGYLDLLSAEERLSSWEKTFREGRVNVLVAEVGEEVVGFAVYGEARDKDLSDQEIGEVGAIYVLPSYQGRGLGGKLFSKARRCLKELGYQSLIVWVLAQKESSIEFYRSYEMKEDGRSEEVESRGYQVGKVVRLRGKTS